ncbi:MAG: metalloregulator ArsR/SmtB family transcription factor [Saprospirales bacterium]|nr:metalloregulator ArsR/SmtB family transcription factor [Saprospirales bacterium]MBK8920698.1 metalloregulator ArsR/SmtB family transcription factor [Saprospirales bacterium]
MKKRTFKDNIYSGIAGMTKAFSSPNRLEIIDLLANGEKTVEQIAVQTAITVANASQHLQVLKTSRLVKSRREGTFIWYSLNGVNAFAAWKALRDLALELEPAVQATLRQFRQEMGSPGSVHYNNHPANEQILFLDVRPTDEFAAGHLPDARSIPVGELSERLTELPRDKTIIAYCRGPFCTYADEAVQLLRANGFQALRLEESYLDLKIDHN